MYLIMRVITIAVQRAIARALVKSEIARATIRHRLRTSLNNLMCSVENNLPSCANRDYRATRR